MLRQRAAGFGFQFGGRIAAEGLIAHFRGHVGSKEGKRDGMIAALLVGSMLLLPIVGAVFVGWLSTGRGPGARWSASELGGPRQGTRSPGSTTSGGD